jgi:hypothetical protein
MFPREILSPSPDKTVETAEYCDGLKIASHVQSRHADRQRSNGTTEVIGEKKETGGKNRKLIN